MNRNQISKFRIAVYGVLLHDGKVLFTETKVPSGIIVNLPGGGLDLGEAPENALAREFIEETKLEVRVGELLFCSRRFHQNPDFPNEQLIHVYYRVHRNGGTLVTTGNDDDVAGTLWCSPSEIPTARIQPVDLEFLEDDIFRSILWK